MGFREHLSRAVDDVPGAILCTLMGQDGIAIDTCETPASQEQDAATSTIELSGLLRQVNQSTSGLRTGKLKELVVEGQDMVAIVRPLTEEYFLALLMQPSGNLGKGRYVLRVMSPRLLAELS